MPVGQFFTKNTFWLQPHIEGFLKAIKPKIVVDPFAGEGDLLLAAKRIGIDETIGFDIDKSFGFIENDSLLNIPFYKDGFVLTNPPYLAKNSAHRKHLPEFSYFESNQYVDLYQIAIEKVLNVYDYAIFIIPETYLLTDYFKESLFSVTIIEDNPFIETTCPICVACFIKNYRINNPNFRIFKNDLFLFDNIELMDKIKKYNGKENHHIKFNIPKGNLGLRAIDGIYETDRIRFCLPIDLNYNSNQIKHSSRAISILQIDQLDIDEKVIIKLNNIVEDYRKETFDVLLAPFKNNNKNGKRRRRLDFKTAKNFINLL